VQARLRNAKIFCASFGAFAAVLEDETVVTWGNPSAHMHKRREEKERERENEKRIECS